MADTVEWTTAVWVSDAQDKPLAEILQEVIDKGAAEHGLTPTNQMETARTDGELPGTWYRLHFTGPPRG